MKKIGIFALVLIFALGALGVGYANWYDNLFIKGTVATGTIDPVFSCPQSNDSGSALDPAECSYWEVDGAPSWMGTRKDKDVGTTIVDVNATDHKILEIEVTNAYPCYYGSVVFCIVNEGTVPVHVDSLKIVEISKGEWVKQVDWVIEKCKTVYIDFEGKTRSTCLNENIHDFSLHLSHLELEQQLDPYTWAGSPELWGDLCVHVEQDAEQSTTYDFKVEIVFRNYDD